MQSELLTAFEKKTISQDALYDRAVQDFTLLPEVLAAVDSPKASVRYGCSKLLLTLSAEHPGKLYPHIDEFFARLGSKHRILVWNAMATIGNLAAVDTHGKIDANLDNLLRFVNDEYLVTVANLVAALGKIAAAKPTLIPKVASTILQAENHPTTPHLTDECKLVLAEKALEAFDGFCSKMSPEDRQRAVAFAKRCRSKPRASLQRKAEQFLEDWSDCRGRT